ncbi:hypothetical protein [Mesorhizobium sp.]|uniref:hypothetical protein n=1 Tax=Mesorhizobium sp. TaxID=1871066 RepID=UPI0011FE0382|nr:hypothetical protein [Mesorhizobium sp.]TIL29049.1 MAG: hypothetical protein E5Y85_29960 [Mesorhizobium sp.]TIL55516.1 MAG: hypothetical protein E5Y79_34050 [Mesorhizobium sp.]TIM05732.1 MAG: hypothetical protein E5Y67_31950 [Mesorhizobium sp.]TIM37716.1 MAG: hypothetical protein E5Y56_32645 [Mesorhizobium sp.]
MRIVVTSWTTKLGLGVVVPERHQAPLSEGELHGKQARLEPGLEIQELVTPELSHDRSGLQRLVHSSDLEFGETSDLAEIDRGQVLAVGRGVSWRSPTS